MLDGLCGKIEQSTFATDKAFERKMCSRSKPALSVRGLFQILFFALASQPKIEDRLRLGGNEDRTEEKKAGID